MRSDMSKVIVERPRYPPTGKPLGRSRQTDLETLPYREGMRAQLRRRTWCLWCCNPRKTLAENLNPLRRFLEQRVGQPWDSVFSEICTQIRITSTVQKHVRDHIEDFVVVKTSIDSNGRIWDHSYAVSELKVSQGRGGHQFWVHPVSGILLDERLGR